MAFWNKKKADDEADALPWDEQARAALAQALDQAPIPKMLRGKVKKELKKAAEDAAKAVNRAQVTAEDVLQGMLANMPENMRSQVENALKEGPDALKNLEKKFRRN